MPEVVKQGFLTAVVIPELQLVPLALRQGRDWVVHYDEESGILGPRNLSAPPNSDAALRASPVVLEIIVLWMETPGGVLVSRTNRSKKYVSNGMFIAVRDR